jgi:rubrerythrin
MTVRADLERAMAMAESAKGNYLLFAVESDDEKAKQVFTEMAEDMKRHAAILASRQEYLNQHNKLNEAMGVKSGKKEVKP